MTSTTYMRDIFTGTQCILCYYYGSKTKTVSTDRRKNIRQTIWWRHAAVSS